MMSLRLLLDALVSWGAFIINYFVIRPLDGKPGFNMRKTILSVVITIISVYVLSDLIFGFRSFLRRGTFNLGFDSAYFFKDLIVSAIILIGIYTIKILHDRQQYALENERLLRENLESQFESLRTQVSPHFLFNSLSALKSLIPTNTEKAMNYLDHLSDVLRQTLKNNREKTVSVLEEINILRSYVYLLKMRYEDNLQVNVSVSESMHSYKVPQLALQTLVENAVKHNIISNRRKMTIDVFDEDDHLVVRNTLQPKEEKEPGTGFGLSNLTRQYELISDMAIHISKTKDTFQVAIPVIKKRG